MTRAQRKLERIRQGDYRRSDFLIADAKDSDMGPSMSWAGPVRDAEGRVVRTRTRSEWLDEMASILEQDIVDIMLTSVSNLEQLVLRGAYGRSGVKPVIRANDASDIWRMRGATYAEAPSRPFRSASLAKAMALGADLGLYSITFNNDLDADLRSLDAFAAFRRDAEAAGFDYFLEVFNPNVETGIDAETLPHYINDCLLRCLAGLTIAERPQFLKIAYNGPKALEELASFDPTVIVGVLGGGAGTTRDCFELLYQAERYGARVALFGRKINLAERPLEMVRHMRAVTDGDLTPLEATRSYHGALETAGIAPWRPAAEDEAVTEEVLKAACSA
ncbi:MAG: hypothetical protein R3F54_18300 [Alphaproteobacteria bacterium]